MNEATKNRGKIALRLRKEKLMENWEFTNLLEETTVKLELCGKTWGDVRFIDDGENCSGDVLGFKKAIDFFYDDGYGSAEINEVLKIVGENWWLERHEYDGSEWWEYKEKPIFDTKREGKIKIRED